LGRSSCSTRAHNITTRRRLPFTETGASCKSAPSVTPFVGGRRGHRLLLDSDQSQRFFGRRNRGRGEGAVVVDGTGKVRPNNVVEWFTPNSIAHRQSPSLPKAVGRTNGASTNIGIGFLLVRLFMSSSSHHSSLCRTCDDQASSNMSNGICSSSSASSKPDRCEFGKGLRASP
jgi:hypothetical protein